MGLNIKNAKRGVAPVLAPAENHVARCYAVVDLGTHTTSGKFGDKTNRKLRLSFELPYALHVFDSEVGEQPLAVHKEYNWVFGDKSSLQIDLQKWFNKKITPDTDLDIEKLVGKTCMVLVAHETGKNGNTYAKITAITPVAKGVTVPDAINVGVYYDIDMGKNDVFKQRLPDFLQERIAQCHEWNDKPTESPEVDNFLGGLEEADEATTTAPDDDIPF